ncbi:MAG: hypothetical protein OQL16_02190 [Gammaproteobacteria bacterium]|nr:hypothetical protein [Gammaproteobacteria bacterium]
MEDNENNIKIKIKARHYLYLGAFVVFCLVVTLVIQITMVAEQVSQAEEKAIPVWDNYPQLVSVQSVYIDCRNGVNGYEEGYFTKEQCQQSAMKKAREKGLEAEAGTAFNEYKARVDELKNNIEEPWPLSIVSRSIMRVAGDLP